MYRKILKTLIFIVLALLILTSIAYELSISNFANLKKYDEKESKSAISKLKKRIIKETYYTTKVKIKNDKIVNLGDFTLNISRDKKLIANISLKFQKNSNSDWIDTNSMQNEILTKGDVLRSVIVNTLSGKEKANVSNEKMKKELVENLNNYLTHGKIEAVYFNKFIIQ